MSKLHDAAARVVAARNKPDGSWDDLKEAIGELEDLVKIPSPAEGTALDGGPAFPFLEPPTSCNVAPGMSLRDWFAGRAIPPLYPNNSFDYGDVAKTAYAVADALLAERAKGGVK